MGLLDILIDIVVFAAELGLMVAGTLVLLGICSYHIGKRT